MTDTSKSTPTQVGPYRLEHRLGAGGMGQVYRAFDERLERRVALKQILPDAAADTRVRQRFLREARAAASLNHPAIVQIHDILEVDGCDWIVMELVDGDTLDDLVQRGALPADRVVALAVELAAGLEAAHSEGIVHRDLKAKNVLVNRKGKVKILDFGLAKPMQPDEPEVSISIAGQVVGTPRAMSPEQAIGGDVDHRSDLFSLGTLLYEMATGTSPFTAPGVIATVTRVCTHRQEPAHEINPAVPRELSALIDRLLEKEPSHRPQTAREVIEALRELAGSGGLPAPGRAAAVSTSSAETYDGTGRRQSTAERQRATVERRQITVMACELIDAEESTLGLDPETLVEVVPDFHALVRDAIAAFDGHLGSGLGHRLVVYFGYPQAHEDDARRAVKAALRILAEIEDANAGAGGERLVKLAARIGVHTGVAVVMPDAAGNEQVALGQTLEVANRVESLAAPNTIVVSPATHPLIEGFFVEEALAPAELPGFADPVSVHRVVSAHDIHTRVELAEPLLPLIGRQQELDLLFSRWQLARAGTGQVVLLSGEAGIGKSRLVYTLERKLLEDGAGWLMCYGSPYALSSPLRPVIELLRRLLDLGGGDASRQLDRLEKSLGQYGFEPSEAVPLFASLFGLSTEGRYAPLPVSPEKQRAETMEAILALFLEMADRQPLGLVVEDLHWMDPSTLELLGLLIDQASGSPLLLVLTFRNEFEAPWRQRAYLTQLNLNRLVGEELDQLIDRVPGGKDLPAEVRRQIVDKTDGVPLFVEELTKTVLESGMLEDGPGSSSAVIGLNIPATLRDSLTARLDRLGDAKEVAQVAAVIGRGFQYPLLAAVSPLEEGLLKQELDRLVEAELVVRRGFGTRAQYMFRHALIQDAAYDSLLKGRRKQYHRQIAEALEEKFPETAADRPELLARHYTEAGASEPAARCWLRAGQEALGRSAVVEAIGRLQEGLQALAGMPAGKERERLELGLQASLGPAMIVNRGFAAPEVEQAYGRAHELSKGMPDSAQMGAVLRGLIQFSFTRGNLEKAVEQTSQLMQVAKVQDSVPISMAAHFHTGVNAHFTGRPAFAREHFERVLELDSPDRTEPCSVSGGGDDLGIEALCNLAMVLWILGYPDQALQRNDQAVALARQIYSAPQSPGLAWALAWKVLTHHCRRELGAVAEWGEKAVESCNAVGVPIWLAQTYILLGSATVLGSEPGGDGAEAAEESLQTMRQAYDSFCQTGARIWRPYLLAHVVEGYAHLGRPEAQLLEEATTTAAETGEVLWQAEHYRLAGRLALIAGGGRDETAAESLFQRALEVARAQQARSLELRAAIDLAELWRSQGEEGRALDFLAPLLEWFDEGRETGDLAAAEALRASLS